MVIFLNPFFCCCCSCSDISAKILNETWNYDFTPLSERPVPIPSEKTAKWIDEKSLPPEHEAFYQRIKESYETKKDLNNEHTNNENLHDIVSPILYIPFFDTNLCSFENILELSDKQFYFIPNANSINDRQELDYLLNEFRSEIPQGVARAFFEDGDRLTLAFKLKELGYPLNTYIDIVPPDSRDAFK